MDLVFDVDGFSGSCLRCSCTHMLALGPLMGGCSGSLVGLPGKTHGVGDHADVKLGSATGAAAASSGLCCV